jgi:hypothetical protein
MKMKKLLMVLFLMVLGGTLSTSSLVSPAAASGTSVGFNLVGPQSTKADSGPFAGDTLQTTGSGSFDTSGSIVAGGSFTHFKANGTVFARGTWQATSFVSFTSFGGKNPGSQGGELNFIATFFPNGETPVTGLSVTVVCRIDAPSGFTKPEGVTVGNFTDVTRGATLFHLD